MIPDFVGSFVKPIVSDEDKKSLALGTPTDFP